AQTLLAGIEILSMLRKGQYVQPKEKMLSPSTMFYHLVA
ncbi:IS6 family transposase, partial [Providencia rettgeri]|nr:IS6 family transposase [Providencia rettgeri]MCG9509890.1 IS6 family transposase [Providencia rettgeri]